jgi:outer membrane protein TolC
MSTRRVSGVFLRTCAAGLVLLAGSGGGGCASSRLDKDIRGLVEEQSQRLRQDLETPQVPNPKAGASRARLLAKSPPTENPPASELVFETAAEDRDVAARLRALAAQSGLEDSAYAKGGGTVAVPGVIPARLMTLNDVLRTTQQSAPELLAAQEEYLLAAIRLLSERHLWGPRLFNDTTVSVAGDAVDGNFDHALNLINQLRVAKRLPSGGDVEARWVWNASEQLRDKATGEYTSASSLVLAGNVPLLRGAGSVAREELIQAERDLVYQSRSFERFRRSFLVDIAQDYFDLLETRASIVNQLRQLESLKQFNAATQARADAGRLEAFQTAITENRLRTAEASLAGLRERYILQLDRYKVRLGMNIDERIDLSDDLPTLPEPAIDLDAATTRALVYRLDVQNSKDRVDDTRRGVANAKNRLLPDLDATGSVTIPTDSREESGALAIDEDQTRYNVGVTLGLPLDRRTEQLSARSAEIRLQRSIRDHDQLLDRVAVDVRGAVRSVELARFQLNLAEQQVEINRRRLRGQKLQEDTLQPQQIVDSENDLLDSENARDRARTALRNAVLNYLLQSDQLRVARDGTLQPLPGM